MDGCGLACVDERYPEICAHDGDCPKRVEAKKDPPPGCCRRPETEIRLPVLPTGAA